MSEAVDINLRDQLMEPVPGAAPAGDDLRLDASPQSLYFRLRDARAEARAAERLADNDPALRGAMPAQWATVHALATEALATRTKDIEVACWLTESLTRRQGLAGLACGADVLAGLISRYWDGLFPAADDEDKEGRLVAVTGMSGQERDGSLMQPLRKVLLFVRQDGTPITFWEFERSKELAALGSQGEKVQRATAGIFPFAELEAGARGDGRASMGALGRDAAQALAAWQALEEAVGRVAEGDGVPATGRVRSLLEGLVRLAGHYCPVEAPVAAGAAGEEPPGNEAVPAAAAPGPKLRAPSREAMLDEVLRIASSFRQNEPNSPLSLTLEEAVRRARLSWPELLRELLPDLAARSAVLTGAGIRLLPE